MKSQITKKSLRHDHPKFTVKVSRCNVNHQLKIQRKGAQSATVVLGAYSADTSQCDPKSPAKSISKPIGKSKSFDVSAKLTNITSKVRFQKL